MKRYKKFINRLLCVMAALAVVITTIPAVTFAGEGAQSITTAEEFAAMAADGDYKLENDITITAPYENAFSGTFDGQGHTVTMNISKDGRGAGMFGSLAGGAVIKNVITAGSVSANNREVGGIAGSVNVYDGNILIENCKNTASVSGTKAIGGIIGMCSSSGGQLKITGCSNTALVTGSNIQVGGIAGNIEKAHIIENCSNTGDITGFNNYAGILGRGVDGVSVINCYTTGSVTATAGSGNKGFALVGGGKSSGTCNITNSYALEGTGSELAYATGMTIDAVSSYKTAEELQSTEFAETLGDAYIFKNGGYPSHTWEIPSVRVPFNVTPAEAVISINGGTYTGAAEVSLPAGSYDYSISAVGYVSKTGTVTVTDNEGVLTAEPASVTETLEEDAAAYSELTVVLVPADAEFVLKDGETEVSPQADGKYKLLKDHSYSYSASKEGYSSENGTIELTADETKTITLKEISGITLTGEYKTSYYVGDELDTTGLSVVVKYSDSSEETVTEGFTVTGFDSSAPAAEQLITVGYAGKTATYKIKIEKPLAFEDFFTKLEGFASAENDASAPFKPMADKAGNYLQSSNKTSYSKSEVTITAEKASRISFKYMVSESGSMYTSSDHGMLVSVNGNRVFRAEEVSTEWKDYDVYLAAGDVLEIEYSCYYNSYSMTQDDEDWLRLKDFDRTPVTCVTFDVTPADAAVSLEKDGKTIEPRDGKYLLAAGAYKYFITAFGYEGISGKALAIDGSVEDLNITEVLNENEKVNITLKVTPGDAEGLAAVLKNNYGTVMPETAAGSLVYEVPEGETYSVEVSANGYITETKYFEADKTKDVEVSLAPAGSAWDGTTKTEPSKENGIYLISNAEELAWFADLVKTDPAISGKLTENINLNNKTWTGFGTYDYSDDSSGYAGTLDGNGKIISGYAGTGGLIECLAPSGIVKNLTVNGTVTGAANTGGIVNTSKGTIDSCAFSGKINTSYGYGSTGGIAGRCPRGNVIRNCSSNAEIKNTYQYYNSTLNVGGIAGYTYGTVENCYFTGSISADASKTSNKGIGGIAGQLYADGVINNSYAAGSVTGPEAGIGAVAGISSGKLNNVYCLTGTAPNAIADNKGTGTVQIRSQSAMKEPLFAYTLGEAFNLDTDLINAGFPVLKWQGGSAPKVPEFEQDIASDKAALKLKDAKRARELEAQKAEVDAEIAAEGGIEALRELFEDDTLTVESFYEMAGIDLKDDGTLEADTDNKYQIKREAELLLPTAGEKGTTIVWTSSDETVIDPETGIVTLPADGKAEIKLKAEISKGSSTDTADFDIVVWSENAVDAQTLADVKEDAERQGNAIQPLQIYGQTTVKEAMEQYLGRKEYKTEAFDGEGIKVEFISKGTKVSPGDSKEYIDENGTVTYFTGTGTGYASRNAIYDGVKLKLILNNVSTVVSVRVNIGWDVDHVDKMLADAMNAVTWDTIKKDNTNTASEKFENGWLRTVVDGKVTGDLLLPYSISGNTWLTIKWSADDAKALYATDNGDGTYTATPERPAKGEPDNKFTLIGTGTFNFWDDYTYEEMNSQGAQAEPAEARKLFDITVPANDTDQSEQIEAALDKYPTLLRDFVDKTAAVDPDAVKADIQMPTPSTLENEGILPDRYNQKVTMTSSDTDVLEFYGYHAKVYRPLPGSGDAVVEYTIKISDRRNNATLAEKTFTMTVKPLAQSEIDEAAEIMRQVCTDDVYWNGIKGGNSGKDNITESLQPFAEILYKDGTPEYIRGAINITFGGIEVDDIPGYDPMGSQPWREFRSSRNGIISCEQLLLTRPEYNTKVKIDSVLTYTEYGKYWEKFGGKAEYAMFEQFYKQPVSAEVIVKGRIDMFDPDENKEINVTVNVTGSGFEEFKDIAGYNFKATLSDDKTAWDALEACLIANGYTIEGNGSYISAVTDSNGVTLEDVEHGIYSGWMYTVNGVAPTKMLKDLYIEDGDVITFYYSDGKEIEDFMSAYEVETLIDKIPEIEDLTLDDSKTVADAENAYNKLTDEQKGYIPAEKADKLKKAVKKMAELKKQAAESFEDAYKTTGDHLAGLLKENEGFGTEWAVFGLARADRLSDIDADAYYKNIVEMLKKKGSPKLSNTKSTENSRLILALTALGRDVTDVGGYNLLKPLADLDFINKQGINGAVWALTAFDSHDYEIPLLEAGTGGTQATRENLIGTILAAQLPDGGFALTGNEADPDMTAMAIQALANYYDTDPDVKAAIDKALNCLSDKQDPDDGGFMGSDGKSSESCAQVITALTKMGIDPSSNPGFVKNGHSVLDALLSFYVNGGGFEHVSGDGINGIASEQGYYALAAYSRMLSDKSALFDMRDIKITKNENKPAENETTKPDGKTDESGKSDKDKDKVPNSGDESNPGLWAMLMLAAFGAAVAAVLRRKKTQ